VAIEFMRASVPRAARVANNRLTEASAGASGDISRAVVPVPRVYADHGIIGRVSELTRHFLQHARDALDAAFQGYFVVKDQPTRRMAGFRNVIVFSEIVREALENLPGDGGGFDRWYKPIRKELRASTVTRLFAELYAEIRKREAAGVDSKARVVGFSYPADVPKLGKRPAHARELFMGDELGGVGWEVEVLPGVVEKYYAILPAAYGTVEEFLSFTAVVQTSRDPRPIDAARVCEQFIVMLEKIVRGAAQFG
jgi:hypothetical protein